jgi:hypothetical protein
MAQSALTVTTETPTPPTNLVNTGANAPNPATFDPLIYTSAGTGLGDGLGDMHYPRVSSAPYYDDGIPAAIPNSRALTTANGHTLNEPDTSTTWPVGITFAAKKAALAVGGTSVDHEQLGAETVVTATSGNPNGLGQLKMVGVGPAVTAAIRAAGPNASHASSLSPTTPLTPTTTGASGASNVSGIGTTLLTVTGTNYDRTSVVYLNGVAQITNYVSATSLTVTNALKRTTAGTLPVYVINGSSGIQTATVNWTLS